ncbi:hypothetical protein [Streptomyces sp. b94]|nr:hypothetical protein [Streptomyces sp. b94]
MHVAHGQQPAGAVPAARVAGGGNRRPAGGRGAFGRGCACLLYTSRCV